MECQLESINSLVVTGCWRRHIPHVFDSLHANFVEHVNSHDHALCWYKAVQGDSEFLWQLLVDGGEGISTCHPLYRSYAAPVWHVVVYHWTHRISVWPQFFIFFSEGWTVILWGKWYTGFSPIYLYVCYHVPVQIISYLAYPKNLLPWVSVAHRQHQPTQCFVCTPDLFIYGFLVLFVPHASAKQPQILKTDHWFSAQWNTWGTKIQLQWGVYSNRKRCAHKRACLELV